MMPSYHCFLLRNGLQIGGKAVGETRIPSHLQRTTMYKAVIEPIQRGSRNSCLSQPCGTIIRRWLSRSTIGTVAFSVTTEALNCQGAIMNFTVQCAPPWLRD